MTRLRILWIVWGFAVLGVLIWYLLQPDAFTFAEKRTLFILAMCTLTFPLGLLALMLLAIVVEPAFGLGLESWLGEPAVTLIQWAVMTLAAILQWAVFFPKFATLVRRKTRSKL